MGKLRWQDAPEGYQVRALNEQLDELAESQRRGASAFVEAVRAEMQAAHENLDATARIYGLMVVYRDANGQLRDVHGEPIADYATCGPVNVDGDGRDVAQ